jgi:ergosteryl-3beta-O-L-aspartate synthase
MAIASDFERVYEIGPVFRAENSNTHRHLTEYTGLDIEMTIEEHYHEALEVVDTTIKHIFSGLYKQFRREIDTIKQQLPHEDLVWLEETPVIPFADAVQLLVDSGWLDENGKSPSPEEDLSTRDEIRLGELIKEKYHTDYYVLDEFPMSARPFYTMPSPKDARYTNSFDIFVRGQEIVSGGQRIHEAQMLEDSMRNVGIDPSSMEEYMDGFRWGAPPHAGAGIGLERLVMLILQLGNIRLASMFHRDPKSLPTKPTSEKLPHPEANTMQPCWRQEDGSFVRVEDRKMPCIFDLIANYGDATTTSWHDERYKIWRDVSTGAAIAFVPSNGFAILPGSPLCDPSQYLRTISMFLRWLKKESKLKPIWILCSIDVEEVLGKRLGWRTLTCVADERVDPQRNPATSNAEVARKVRHAKSEGVKITDLPEGKPVPEDVKQRANAQVQRWLAHRKGTQIHLSNIDLFLDEPHRRFFYAEDKLGQLCGIAVLAKLAPRLGWQAKYTLDFPGAPSGTIEYITTHAIAAAAASGIKSLTFGGGATGRLIPGHHLSGAKVRLLEHAYEAAVKQFNLDRKSGFRAKMGATEEPLWIAYPPHGLGTRGIKAVMDFLRD